MTLKTQRLILRPWTEADLEPFARMNADPRVMEFFPGLKSSEESDAMVKSFSEHITKWGWGIWAVSLIETGQFIGFIGLQHISFTAHFTPAVEIGWRLAFDYWGKGYAPEGAKACLEYAFKTLKLDEVVALTAVQNRRSRSVMEKIGMNYDPKDDFDHPRVALGNRVSRHVLYRIKKSEF